MLTSGPHGRIYTSKFADLSRTILARIISANLKGYLWDAKVLKETIAEEISDRIIQIRSTQRERKPQCCVSIYSMQKESVK